VPSQARKHRGYAAQRIVAEWFALHGHPFAESTGAGRSGTDVTGLVGIADVEVKATSSFQPLAWIRQMRERVEPGGVYFGVWRPNGYGPMRIGEWPVVTTLDVMTRLLLEAGYGDSSAVWEDEPRGE
jgi:hypothetical protein